MTCECNNRIAELNGRILMLEKLVGMGIEPWAKADNPTQIPSHKVEAAMEGIIAKIVKGLMEYIAPDLQKRVDKEFKKMGPMIQKAIRIEIHKATTTR